MSNSGCQVKDISPNEVRELVNKISDDHSLKEVISAFVDNTDNAAIALKSNIASWFDEGMSRVSGWYRRRVKAIIIVIATAVTVTTNASSIHIAEELWRNDALRTVIAAEAQVAAERQDVNAVNPEHLENLQSFPIGWQQAPDDFSGWVKLVIGWVISIAAISLGAPFWFDLLGKVANLRGTDRTMRAMRQASQR